MQRSAFPFLIVTLAAMLVGVGTLILLLTDANTSWNQTIFLQCLLVLVLSVGSLFVLKRSIPFVSLRTGVNLVFVLLFSLWPMAYMADLDVSAGYLSIWVRSSDEYFVQALWYAIAGIICFQLGYLLPVGKKLARKISPPKYSWSKSRIVFVSVVATFASLLSALAVWSQLGGSSSFGTLFGRAKVALDGYHYLTLGITLLRVSILVAWAYSIVRRFPRWAIWAQVILYSIIGVTLGGRNQVITLWLMLFLMHLLLTGRTFSFRSVLSVRVLTSGLVVVGASILLLIVVRGFRTTYDPSSTGVLLVILQNIGDSVAAVLTPVMREFNQLEVFSTVIAITPTQIPFWNGQSYLDILTLPIPRSLWPEKPIPARLILGQLMRARDVGIPITMIGEFYINFGLVGILSGMSLFGVICRTVDRWTQMYRANPAVIIFFVFVLTNLPIILTRYFYGWFAAVLIFGIVLWMVVRFVGIPAGRDTRYVHR